MNKPEKIRSDYTKDYNEGHNKAIADYEKFLPNEDEIRMMFSKHPCGANEYYETLVKQIAQRIGIKEK